MKWMIGLGLFLVTSVSHASSYYSYTCATADGIARWEESHDDYSIYLKYTDWTTGEVKKLAYEKDKVKIRLKSKRTIRKISRNEGCEGSEDHYFSAHATVRPTPEIAEEFKKGFGKSFKDYVICHHHVSGESCR